MKEAQIQVNKLYNEDCLATMSRMPESFLDLTITSPPYDDLKTYDGYSFDFESVAQELYRVTKPGGVVVWVVKDSVINGGKSLTSFKQALFFQQIGFVFYDTILHAKAGGILPAKRRYRDAFEYMFVLSKGRPRNVNLIEDRINKHGGTYIKRRRIRYKDGSFQEKGPTTIKDRNVRYNIWSYSNGTSDDLIFHPAPFPERLAADHIVSWTNEGDLIYDCFMGSGTVAKQCILLKRNFIGSEISNTYCFSAEKRLLKYVDNQLVEKVEVYDKRNAEIDFLKEIMQKIIVGARRLKLADERTMVTLEEVAINQLSYKDIIIKHKRLLDGRQPSGLLDDLKSKNSKFARFADEILSKNKLPKIRDVKWSQIFKRRKKFERRFIESLIISPKDNK
jgi:DNA modification methylase